MNIKILYTHLCKRLAQQHLAQRSERDVRDIYDCSSWTRKRKTNMYTRSSTRHMRTERRTTRRMR